MSGIDEYYNNRNSIQDSIINDMASTSQFFDHNAPDWQDKQGSFKAGFNSGIEGSKGMYYGFKGMMADALGMEDAKLESIDDMMEHSRRASVYGTGKVTDMFDIESFSNGKDYLAYGAGQVVPDLLMALGTVVTGGATGFALAGKKLATATGREALESYSKKLIGKNLIIDGAEVVFDKTAANAMKMGIANKAKRDQYRHVWNAIEKDYKSDMMKKVAGRFNMAQSMVMSQGEAYQGTVEAGNPDAMKGMIFGSLAGLVEAYGENKILGGLFPNVAKVGTGKGAVRGFLAKLGKGASTVGKGMVTEGATEAMQETIFEFNQALADDGWDVEKAFGEMTNVTVLKRLANAFAMGSIGGGMMGGGSATMGAIFDAKDQHETHAKEEAEIAMQEEAFAMNEQFDQDIVDQGQAQEQAIEKNNQQDYEQFQANEQLQADEQLAEQDTTLEDLKQDIGGRKAKKDELTTTFQEDAMFTEKEKAEQLEIKAQEDAMFKEQKREETTREKWLISEDKKIKRKEAKRIALDKKAKKKVAPAKKEVKVKTPALPPVKDSPKITKAKSIIKDKLHETVGAERETVKGTAKNIREARGFTGSVMDTTRMMSELDLPEHNFTASEKTILKAHAKIHKGYQMALKAKSELATPTKGPLKKKAKELVTKGKPVKPQTIDSVSDLGIDFDPEGITKRPMKVAKPVEIKKAFKPIKKIDNEKKTPAKAKAKKKAPTAIKKEDKVRTTYQPRFSKDPAKHIKVAQRMNEIAKKSKNKINEIAITHKRPINSGAIESNTNMLFGKKIVWFEDKTHNGAIRDGFVDGADKNTVYLNVNSKKPLMTALGHEVYHSFDEKAKSDVDKTLGGLIKSNKIDALKGNYDLGDSRMREEVLADAFGVLMKDTAALNEIAKTEEGRGLLTHMIEAMERFVRGLRKKFDLLPDSEKRLKEVYSEMFTDVDKAVNTMRDLAKNEVDKTLAKKDIKENLNTDIYDSISDRTEHGLKFLDNATKKLKISEKTKDMFGPIEQTKAEKKSIGKVKHVVTGKMKRLDKAVDRISGWGFGVLSKISTYNPWLGQLRKLNDTLKESLIKNNLTIKKSGEKVILSDDMNAILDDIVNKTLSSKKIQDVSKQPKEIQVAYEELRKLTAEFKGKAREHFIALVQSSKAKKKPISEAQLKAMEEESVIINNMVLLPPINFNDKFMVRQEKGGQSFHTPFDTREAAQKYADSLGDDSKGFPSIQYSKGLNLITKHFDTLAEAKQAASEVLDNDGNPAKILNADRDIMVEEGYKDVAVDSIRDSSNLSVNRAMNFIHTVAREAQRGSLLLQSEDGGHSANEIIGVVSGLLERVEYDDFYQKASDLRHDTPDSLPSTRKYIKHFSNRSLNNDRGDLGKVASFLQSMIWQFKMSASPAKGANNLTQNIVRGAMALAYDGRLVQGVDKTFKRMGTIAKEVVRTTKILKVAFSMNPNTLKQDGDAKFEMLSKAIDDSDYTDDQKAIAHHELAMAKEGTLTEFNLQRLKKRKQDASTWDKIQNAANHWFELSEIINRVSMAIAYDTILSTDGKPETKNASLEDRISWGHEAAENVNFSYDANQMSEWTNSGAGAVVRPVVFPLMTFAFHSMTQTYTLALEAATKEDGSLNPALMAWHMAMRQPSIMAAPLMLFAGLGEEPEEFLNAMTDGDFTYEHYFGKEMGGVLTNGLLAQTSGVDISSSVQQEFIPSPIITTAKWLAGAESKGVTGRWGQSLGKAIDDPTNLRRWAKVLPNAIGNNLLKPFDTIQGDVRNAKGELISEDKDANQITKTYRAFAELMGFSSTARSEVYRREYTMRDYTARVNKNRTAISKRLLKARAEGNSEAVMIIRGEIEDFNENIKTWNEANKEYNKSRNLLTNKTIKTVKRKLEKEEKAKK